MEEAIKKIRRKAIHQRLDAENIELRAQLSGLTTVLGKMHGVILWFALGSNWTARFKRSHWFWKSQWFWEKSLEVAPEYIWVGAGNPEKAADNVMVECFGKDYRERARAAFVAILKEQEANGEKIDGLSLPGSTSAALTPEWGE